MLYIEQHLKDQLSTDLNRGERLIWAGTPKKGIEFGLFDIIMIPFSLFWCAFVAFWIFMAAQVNVFFALFGIPFALVGIYLLVGRFTYDIRKRSKTVYGLTNERVLIKVQLKKTFTTSFQLDSTSDIKLVLYKDGTGSIIFGTLPELLKHSTSSNIESSLPSSTRFYKIKDAQSVYSEILRAQKEFIISSNDL